MTPRNVCYFTLITVCFGGGRWKLSLPSVMHQHAPYVWFETDFSSITGFHEQKRSQRPLEQFPYLRTFPSLEIFSPHYSHSSRLPIYNCVFCVCLYNAMTFNSATFPTRWKVEIEIGTVKFLRLVNSFSAFENWRTWRDSGLKITIYGDCFIGF